MPVIPTIGGPSVSPSSPYPNAGPQLQQPDYTSARIAQAAAQAAGKMGELGEQYIGEQRKQEKRQVDEGRAVAVANGMLDFDARASTRTAKFKQQRGVNALDARADTFAGYDEDRQAVAESLGPDARAEFLERSAASVMAYRRQLEHHADREFEAARDETLKAREHQAIGMAEAGIPDFETWLVTSRSVERDIRAAARTPEQAEAQVSAFRADSGLALVNGLVASGRVEDAAKYVDANKATLGNNFTEAAHAVAQGMAGKKKDVEAAVADRWAGEAVDKARRPSGYIDEAKALQALASVPADRYDEARKALEHHLTVEGERKKADLDQLRNAAWAIDNQRRALPGLLVQKLNDPVDGDPKFLSGLLADQEARYRRAKADREGTAKERSEAKQAQKDANHIALQELMSLPAAERAAVDLNTWAVGRDVNDVGMSDLKRAKGGAAETVQKGNASLEARFADDAAAAVKPLITTKGKLKTGLPETSITNVRANAAGLFQDFVAREKRQPTEAEQQEMIGQLQSAMVTKVNIFGRPSQSQPVGVLPPVPIVTPVTPPKPPPAAQNEQARAWALAHPDDPRSKAILDKLAGK